MTHTLKYPTKFITLAAFMIISSKINAITAFEISSLPFCSEVISKILNQSEHDKIGQNIQNIIFSEKINRRSVNKLISLLIKEKSFFKTDKSHSLLDAIELLSEMENPWFHLKAQQISLLIFENTPAELLRNQKAFYDPFITNFFSKADFHSINSALIYLQKSQDLKDHHLPALILPIIFSRPISDKTSEYLFIVKRYLDPYLNYKTVRPYNEIGKDYSAILQLVKNLHLLEDNQGLKKTFKNIILKNLLKFKENTNEVVSEINEFSMKITPFFNGTDKSSITLHYMGYEIRFSKTSIIPSIGPQFNELVSAIHISFNDDVLKREILSDEFLEDFFELFISFCPQCKFILIKDVNLNHYQSLKKFSPIIFGTSNQDLLLPIPNL